MISDNLGVMFPISKHQTSATALPQNQFSWLFTPGQERYSVCIVSSKYKLPFTQNWVILKSLTYVINWDMHFIKLTMQLKNLSYLAKIFLMTMESCAIQTSVQSDSTTKIKPKQYWCEILILYNAILRTLFLYAYRCLSRKGPFKFWSSSRDQIAGSNDEQSESQRYHWKWYELWQITNMLTLNGVFCWDLIFQSSWM